MGKKGEDAKQCQGKRDANGNDFSGGSMREQIYYIYRHTRLDKNEVFYIGRGKAKMNGQLEKTFYYRAYGKTQNGRNKWWHRIIRKTDYLIEIIFQSIDEELVRNKETEFIKLYGRRDLKQGSLVNLSDGGETYNVIVSPTTRAKMSRNSGIKGKFGGEHHGSKPVFAYTLEGYFYKKFDSRIDASRELNIPQGNVVDATLNLRRFTGTWRFKEQYEGEYLGPVPLHKGLRAVLCLDLNMNVIQEFNSITAAAKFIQSPLGTIVSSCYRGTTHKGFKFKFKNSPLKSV